MSTDQPRPGQDPIKNDASQVDHIQDTMPIDSKSVTGPPADAQPTIELAAPAAAWSDPGQQPTTEFVLPPAAPAPPADPVVSPVSPVGSVSPVSSDEPAPPVTRPTPRVATVVWGLVLALIGAGVITAAAGYEFDVELAAIALLVLAGVGLVVGSIATSARRRSH